MCYRADYCLYSKVNRNETTVDIVNPVFRRTPLEHVVSTERYVVRRGKEKRRDGEEEEKEEEEERGSSPIVSRCIASNCQLFALSSTDTIDTSTTRKKTDVVSD